MFGISPAARTLFVSCLVLLNCLSLAGPCYSLTLGDAISQARETLPSLMATRTQVSSLDALHKASLGPYFPSLDGSTTQEKHDSLLGDYDSSTYNLQLSLDLFDGGRRRANRSISRLNLESGKEEVAKSLLELEFNVKSAFYAALARREVLQHRETQLKDAEKDYEVAEGRHKFGVAKLSEVLQASVRLEEAKFTLTQAQGELKNTLADLNSLVGRSLESAYDLEGTLDLNASIPELGRLSELALKRPEIRQAENSIKISKNKKSLETSTFFPDVSAVASYSKIDGGLTNFANDEDRSIGLRATWNIFELGKFYRRKAAEFDISISRENLQETIRQLLLGLHKAYNDFTTAFQNIAVAREALKQAEQNYSQAFGEYKVGKGDILSLVQAESALALARIQNTVARLNLMLAKALVERTAGVESLESVRP